MNLNKDINAISVNDVLRVAGKNRTVTGISLAKGQVELDHSILISLKENLNIGNDTISPDIVHSPLGIKPYQHKFRTYANWNLTPELGDIVLESVKTDDDIKYLTPAEVVGIGHHYSFITVKRDGVLNDYRPKELWLLQRPNTESISFSEIFKIIE